MTLWCHSCFPLIGYECYTHKLNQYCIDTTVDLQDIIKQGPISCLLPMCTADAGINVEACNWSNLKATCIYFRKAWINHCQLFQCVMITYLNLSALIKMAWSSTTGQYTNFGSWNTTVSLFCFLWTSIINYMECVVSMIGQRGVKSENAYTVHVMLSIQVNGPWNRLSSWYPTKLISH